MAYDLVVGKSKCIKGAADCVAGIEFNELVAISKLTARVDSFFLQRIANLFEDQAFSQLEVEQALGDLLPLLTLPQLHADEKNLLHKLIAALAYAQWKQLSLYGIAD